MVMLSERWDFFDLQVPLQTYPGRSSSVEGDEGVEGSAPQHH